MIHAAGELFHVDVTVRHPTAAKYLRQAALEDGAANDMAEAAKRLRYPAVASAGLHAVQPFSLEAFGRLGDGALQVLHTAWQRLQERRSDARGWKGIGIFQRWLSLLSCDLQRSLFEAELAVVGDLRLAPLEAPLAATVLPFQRPRAD